VLTWEANHADLWHTVILVVLRVDEPKSAVWPAQKYPTLAQN